jgi:hypothetical protein
MKSLCRRLRAAPAADVAPDSMQERLRQLV